MILQKTNSFLKKLYYVRRNNVFCSYSSNFAVHVKKNTIHITMAYENDFNFNIIDDYLSYVFLKKDISIYIKDDKMLKLNKVKYKLL